MVVHYNKWNNVKDLDFSDFEDLYQVKIATDSRSNCKIDLT